MSRTIKPILETGCCAKPRPPDFFSQKVLKTSLHTNSGILISQINFEGKKNWFEESGVEKIGAKIAVFN